MSPVDELRAAAARLRAFAASDKPVALCYDCGVRGEPEPELEALLAAREPIAAWLESAAMEYWTQDWTDCPTARRALAVARTLTPPEEIATGAQQEQDGGAQ